MIVLAWQWHSVNDQVEVVKCGIRLGTLGGEVRVIVAVQLQRNWHWLWMC